jgi:glycosyltransferase involved in cell wall biosynthesis
MRRTVIVEPHPTGHRFEHVAHVARTALARGDDVELLTSVGASGRTEFATFLAELPLTVHDQLPGFFPPTRTVARAVLDLHRGSPIDTVVLLDADQALKRWWRDAPMALRGHRGPTTVLFLMRFPQNLTPADHKLAAMKVAKVVLAALTRATGAADRIVYLVGRDKSKRAWLLEPLRDPATCRAHARDRVHLRERYGLPLDRRLVGIIGEISIRKCVPTVAEAVRLSGTDVDLLLAGPIAADMQKWLDSLAPADRERVHTRPGFLAEEELDAYVAASDVLSLAMLNPGPSGIQGKALVAGVPVLSAGSKLREREIAAYGVGESVELDAESLASGIRRLLERGDGPISTPGGVPTAEEFGAGMLGLEPPLARNQAVG